MSVQTEANSLGDVLKYESENHYSRDAITVLAGAGADRVLKLGQVLGKRKGTSLVAAANGGNTGNGAMGAVTGGEDLQEGVYTVEITKAAADAGDFVVKAPDGKVVGEGTVAVAFASTHLNFTLADGATDFIVGDKFTVTVSSDGKYREINFAGVDGTEDAAGVLLEDVTAPDGVDAKSTAVVRGPAIVAKDLLVWPAGATQAQKDAALAQLNELGIVARASV